MAYDEGLAERVRQYLSAKTQIQIRRMFGGIAFLVNGNMVCGVLADRLVVRVGKTEYERALQQLQAGPFDVTGKPMRGWVSVQNQGIAKEDELHCWINKGLQFALSLPEK